MCDGIGRPGDADGAEHLAQRQGLAGTHAAAREHRPHAAADAQADEEDGQDDGERVDGGAEQEGEEARPDDLGTQRRHAGEADRHEQLLLSKAISGEGLAASLAAGARI